MSRKPAPSPLERLEAWLWRALITGLIVMVLHATIVADGQVSRLGYGFWLGDAYEPGRAALADLPDGSMPALAGGDRAEPAAGLDTSDAPGDRTSGQVRLLLLDRASLPGLVAWVNGEPRGSFQRAVLSLEVRPGDVVALSGVEPGQRVTVKLISRSRELSGPPLGSTWEVAAEGVVLPIP